MAGLPATKRQRVRGGVPLSTLYPWRLGLPAQFSNRILIFHHKDRAGAKRACTGTGAAACASSASSTAADTRENWYSPHFAVNRDVAPLCLTIRYTMESPSPVPLPGSFVVKRVEDVGQRLPVHA